MKNKKGFTLIEIIVAMAVGAIFVTCVIALISPTTKIFNRVETSSDARMMTESILEEVRNIANYAGKLEAGEGKTIVADESVISVNGDGYLVEKKASEDPQPLFDPKFYAGKTLSMTTVQDGENCVDMTLKVFSDGREIYSVDSRLKPVINKSETFDKYTPEGMLRLARAEIAKNATYEEYGFPNTTQRHDGIRRILQKGLQYYNGDYPEYKATRIISESKLRTRIEKLQGVKPVDSLAVRRCKAWLGEDGDKTQKMCCFVTKGTLIPVVYLTNFYGNFVKQTHSSALTVYWKGTWYVDPNLLTKWPNGFDNKTEDQIESIIKNDWGWIPANEFQP